MIVFIDSGILGILSAPNKVGEAKNCEEWPYTLLSRGVYVCSSELCDNEIRRSLILESQKKNNLNSIENLNELREIISFLPITSILLEKAACIWASARSQGIPTADNKSLDIDIIISAHYQMLREEYPSRHIVIATTNVKHLSRFTQAQTWEEIRI